MYSTIADHASRRTPLEGVRSYSPFRNIIEVAGLMHANYMSISIIGINSSASPRRFVSTRNRGERVEAGYISID